MHAPLGPEGWKTVRAAMRSWGDTLRLIAIVLAISAAVAVPFVILHFTGAG
jgi:hypothetical protein